MLIHCRLGMYYYSYISAIKFDQTRDVDFCNCTRCGVIVERGKDIFLVVDYYVDATNSNPNTSIVNTWCHSFSLQLLGRSMVIQIHCWTAFDYSKAFAYIGTAYKRFLCTVLPCTKMCLPSNRVVK